MLKVGRNSQPSHMCLTVVLSIVASLPFVQSHVTWTSSHSIRRCQRLSVAIHCRHKFVAVILILFNRSCVATMSCMALYQSTFMSSCTGVSCMLLHTVAQSVLSPRSVICMTGRSGVSRESVTMVLKIQRLYALLVSFSCCGIM